MATKNKTSKLVRKFGKNKLALLIVAAAAAVGGGIFVQASHAAIVKPKLWVYGDSITWESNKWVHSGLSTYYSERSGAFPGAAACDNLQFLQNDLVNIAHNKPANYPKYVILELAGNSQATCMIDPSTGQPYVVGSDAYYQKYTQDINAFDAEVHAIGAKMLFVAAPPMRDDTGNSVQSGITSIELATGDPVSYLPQQAVGPGDVFSYKLPCLSTEGTSKGCVAGQIVVRSPDGVHFCPTGFPPFPNPCPVYSSGEYRWGKAYGPAAAAAWGAPPQ